MKTIFINGLSYTLLEKSELLEAETRTGKTKYWQGFALKLGNECSITSEFWQGEDGKHRYAEPYPVTPKNIGKANETTPEEQAVLELRSVVKKQNDKGYRTAGTEKIKSDKPLPMLAHKFRDRFHNIAYPCFIQPKLDGMRMLWNGKEAWTRMGKPFVPECIQHLSFDTKGHIIDGELILPYNPLLQLSLEAARKYHPESSPKLTYQVYDIIDENLVFNDRIQLLRELVKNAPSQVNVVETILVYGEDEIMRKHDEYVELGYEGAIVRNWNSKYLIGHRSSDLQKVKTFIDEEFKIVDVIEGVGAEKGIVAKFVCLAKNGKEFRPRPKGTVEYKVELWRTRKSIIGKEVTVRYRNLSLDGIPVIPVATVIRDYE